MDLIIKASAFANKKHQGQKDDDGLSYFEAHLKPVAEVLMRLNAPEVCIAAGFLHDTLEDTKTTYDELKREFGYKVADIVLEVTHEGKKNSGFYFPRLHSKNAIIVKFADNLSNLCRMGSWDEKRQEHHIKRSKFWKSKEGEKL